MEKQKKNQDRIRVLSEGSDSESVQTCKCTSSMIKIN